MRTAARVPLVAIIDGADRLLSGPAVGPGDSRDGHADVRAQPLPDALSHRLRHGLAHGAVCRDEGRGHAQLLNLDVIRVRDDAALNPGRAAGHVSEPAQQSAARAGLGRGNPPSARLQSGADDGFERSAVSAEDGTSNRGLETSDRVLERPRQRAGVRPGRRYVKFDLTGCRQNRGLHGRVGGAERRVDGKRELLDLRLGAPRDFDHASEHPPAAGPRGNARLDVSLEHGSQFSRRSRKEHHHPLIDLEQQARRGAKRVGQDDGA